MKPSLAIRTDICCICPRPAAKSGWCPLHEREFGVKGAAASRPPADAENLWEGDPMDDQQGAAVVLPAAVEEPQGRFLTSSQQARVEAVVRRELARVARPSVDDVLATVASETGLRLSRGNLYRRFFTPIAKELGVARPRGGDQKTARRSPAPPATVEAAPPSPPPAPAEPPAPQAAALADDPPQAPAQTVFSAADDLVVVMAQESGRVRLTLSILTTQNEASFLVRQAMQAAMPRQRAVEAL